jgi:hypothetical protein
MGLKEIVITRNRDLSAFGLFSVFWLSFLILSGTINSGFHFQDDHEIITISKRIDDNGLFAASVSILKEDMVTRFRPFYYLHRIAIVELLGTDFMYWSFYNALLAILTSFFLYLFLIRQGYKFINAILFPFLTLIGEQSAIWWRLGPAETIGIFFLSASLYLMINSIVNGKRYQLIISVICLIFSSLSKESFALVIPAYVLFFIMINWQVRPGNNILRIIITNIIPVAVFLFILLGLAYVIVFVVGTGGPGYGGHDSSVSIGAYLTSIYSLLRKNEYTDLSIIGLFFLLQNVKTWKINLTDIREKILPFFLAFLIVMLIAVPQFVLYYSTGLWERYLIPLTLGLAFFVVFLSERVYISTGISTFTKRAFTTLIIITVLWFMKSEAIPKAKSFAVDGRSTNKFLTGIIENSKPDDPVLIVLNAPKNYEHAFSIDTYLRTGGKSNLKYLNIEPHQGDDFDKGLTTRLTNAFDTLMVVDIDKHYKCIGVLPFPDNEGIIDKISSDKFYERNDYNAYTVFIKKDVN